MAELWFSALARRLLRRGEFTSRADLTDKITSFAVRYNRTAHPYTWTYDAGADHARYLARRAQHDHPRPTGPSRRVPSEGPHDPHETRARTPSRTYAGPH